MCMCFKLEITRDRNSLGKSDEVLVVGVHVGQLDVNQQQHLREGEQLLMKAQMFPIY